ncbi:hypothetical protein TELCIR_10297 [Teladorsagia circumcincta]|uniref:PABS domain-containing protein n=1 Tax=Teladorsagia circumcincta TaxID=45464 RepID=A0A2G9UCH4_TELCI|nr:hypothetical protein TELCIR_10297 [Teladorsagia circumcincta]
MIAIGFMMEALQLDPEEPQNVLMIGLGGGTLANFFSAADFIKVNLTSVELNPVMVTIAKEWFGLRESQSNTVFIEDGVNFLLGAAQRGLYISFMFSVHSLDEGVIQMRGTGLGCKAETTPSRRNH